MKFGLALLAAGGLLLLFGFPDSVNPGPDEPEDVLSAVHAADRIGRVEILRELATKEFDSDQAKATWHNEQMAELREFRERPYLDALAQHLVDGTVADFADELDPMK